MKQSLPGIKKIGFVPCAALPASIPLKADAAMPVSILTAVWWLDILPEASWSLTETVQNGGRLQEVELLFATIDPLKFYPTKMAFAIEDVEGSYWVLGSREAPYPSIQSVRSSGSVRGESAVTKVTVTLKAPRALISLR